MDHPEPDVPLPVSEDSPSTVDGSLPNLLGALDLQPPSLVPAAYLPVDHEEEVVSAPHELPPSLEAGGAIEHQALSVEVPVSVDDIEDFPSLLWFPDDHLAIVQNGHSSSNHNFLDIVVFSSPDPLACSEESVYEDALTGEAEPDVPESVPLALGAGQLARYDSGAGPTFVDPPGDVSVPPENAVYPEDSGLAPVEQLVHIAVPHAIPEAPIAGLGKKNTSCKFSLRVFSRLAVQFGNSNTDDVHVHPL